MSLPQTVTSGPELHSPEEPAKKLQTPPVRGPWRASSEGAPGTRREDTWPGLGTFRRAFSRSSQQASGQAPKEDLGLFQRSSRFLSRSLRRARENSSTADQSHATAVPGVTHNPQMPSRVMDGGGRRSSAGVGREELEPEAGERFTNNTEHGGKLRPEGEQQGPGFLTGCPPQLLQTLPCPTAFYMLPAFQPGEPPRGRSER